MSSSEFSAGAPSADEDDEYDDARARARKAPKKGRKSKAAEPAPDVGALAGILDSWPSSLLAGVLDHLPLSDLLSVARASKRAKEVVLDPERGHLERAFAQIWDYDGEDALPPCPEGISLHEYANLLWPYECSVRLEIRHGAEVCRIAARPGILLDLAPSGPSPACCVRCARVRCANDGVMRS